MKTCVEIQSRNRYHNPVTKSQLILPSVESELRFYYIPVEAHRDRRRWIDRLLLRTGRRISYNPLARRVHLVNTQQNPNEWRVCEILSCQHNLPPPSLARV